MNRTVRIMLAPLLLVVTMGTSATTTTAAPPAAVVADAGGGTFDCDTEGPEWPTKVAVRGATVLGRVISVHEISAKFRTYRLKVLKAFNGDFGAEVRVAIQCATTKLKIGKRYLFSSGQFSKTEDRIIRLAYFEDYGVGWRARGDDSVKLLTYGYSTGASTAPQWLRAPDTIKQAVKAIYPN